MVIWIAFLPLWSPPVFAGHANDSCAITAQQIALGEPNTPTGRIGNRATMLVVDPSPPVTTNIVRSIYIWSTQSNLVEFGWKWKVDPALLGPGETTDTAPTVFAVKVVNGSYYVSEGAGSSNPGWGTLPTGVDRRFRIERDASNSSRFHFYRTNASGTWLYAGFYDNANIGTSGKVFAGDEAKALCDSMRAHYYNLDRKTSSGWAPWADDVKASAFPDASKWWYWAPAAGPGVVDSWILHCGTAYCDDITGA